MRWKTGCGECPRLWDATHSLVFDRTHYFWKKFEKIYSGFEENLKIVCVSDWLRERALQSPFFSKTEISTIENGIDTRNIFHLQINETLNNRYKSDGKKILLHVTPSFKSKIKGGEYIIELSKRLNTDKYLILIVGYDSDSNLPPNIVPIKATNDQNLLAQYYSIADLTIITSKVETYSMVCAESLACGTPVVGFECGAPERIALKDYSRFVEFGNIIELEKTVYEWIDKKSSFQEPLLNIAKDHYSTDRMVNKYIELYKSYK
jgi:glycosyltransferase involved in cell wall biosynthesis